MGPLAEILHSWIFWLNNYKAMRPIGWVTEALSSKEVRGFHDIISLEHLDCNFGKSKNKLQIKLESDYDNTTYKLGTTFQMLAKLIP